MVYVNKGFAQGVLANDPYKAAEGVVLLTLRIRDERFNPVTRRRDFHYPTFVVFGRESDKALEYLEKGQEVSVEYKVETRRKEVDGETRYFEDKVATNIIYGRKPEPREPREERDFATASVATKSTVATQTMDADFAEMDIQDFSSSDEDFPVEDN